MAITLSLSRTGGVGFIDWLGLDGEIQEAKTTQCDGKHDDSYAMPYAALRDSNNPKHYTRNTEA